VVQALVLADNVPVSRSFLPCQWALAAGGQADEVDIDAPLVSRLLGWQFPELAELLVEFPELTPVHVNFPTPTDGAAA
jgi:hypothetical protein